MNAPTLILQATLALLAVETSVAQTAPNGINQSGPNAQGTVNNYYGDRLNLTSRDISGHYLGLLGVDFPRPIYRQAVLDIRMSSEGNFHGTFRSRQSGQVGNVQGKVSGDDIVFEARAPNETVYLSFAGKIIGNIIKGTYLGISPDQVEALEMLRNMGVDPPPGKFEFYK